MYRQQRELYKYIKNKRRAKESISLSVNGSEQTWWYCEYSIIPATASSKKKKKVSCDPILNTINSNKEKRKMVKAGNKSKAVQKS